MERRLEREPGLSAKTLWEELVREHGEKFRAGQRRSFERRVRGWKDRYGSEPELFFTQEHRAGERLQIDWVDCRELGVRIGGEAFCHKPSFPSCGPPLVHVVLPFSNWEWARVCYSESSSTNLVPVVGEDCAGAVQFVRSDRLENLLAEGTEPKVSWMSSNELNERVAAVVADASATRLGTDTGQFSLAGAQPKLALYFDSKKKRWGVPEGRTPTTHILKPATGAYDGQVENEHFCLRLAAELGFPTARSRVMTCDETPVIVIERYDRLEKNGIVRRIHQEDFCQAAGIRPQLKYQNQGGPSPKAIGEILRVFSSSPEEDVVRFIDTLIFHWLTAGPDAHAKNYSILIAPGARARLAPLYDLASALPYPQQIPPRKATMAMKIGSNYRIQQIRRRDWEKLARELRLTPSGVLDRIADLAGRIPGGAEAVAKTIHKEGVRHPVISRIVEQMGEHITRCADALSSTGAS